LHLRRNANAGILHQHKRLVCLSAGRDSQRATMRHGIECVEDEVREHLAQFSRFHRSSVDLCELGDNTNIHAERRWQSLPARPRNR
jgi:hypothetical protein